MTRFGIYRSGERDNWIVVPFFELEHAFGYEGLQAFTDWDELVAYLKEQFGPNDAPSVQD